MYRYNLCFHEFQLMSEISELNFANGFFVKLSINSCTFALRIGSNQLKRKMFFLCK